MHEKLYDLLKDVARQGKTDFYKPVGRSIGIRDGAGMRQLFIYLGEISKHEVAQGRPMLSAVVVNPKDKMPGAGFFRLAKELGRQKGQDDKSFFAEELHRVFTHWNETGRNVEVARNYWFEEYWPQEGRDLDNLFMWFHEKNIKKDTEVKQGDRVVFYEVGRHPEVKVEGAKALFASGTVVDDREYIPEPEQLRGGKRWIFKRKVKTDVPVPPRKGIPLSEVKTLLNIEGLPQHGFQLSQSQFELLEEGLRHRQEEFNQSNHGDNGRINTRPDVDEKPYNSQDASRITPSSTVTDPAERAARLEKSNNAHKALLNKLAETLRAKGYETTVNSQVDLFAKIGDANWIFEVKSTHDGNFLSQVRHGIAQLYEYRYKYRRSAHNVGLCLVLQTAPPDGFHWVVDYLLNDRTIHVCWPVPNGFSNGSEKSLRFLS
ncbi:MAG: hypothetical protein KCHDKBKB_01628 [Elusimicrobia bacterium]|nr:hypothetical protein [Elusimicrobiota bacterium]